MPQPPIRLSQCIDAHNRFESTTTLLNPLAAGRLLSIAHDGFIRDWRLSDLSVASTQRIVSPYLTALVPYGEGFLLGVGSGAVLVLDCHMQVQREVPVHEDCVTGILVGEKWVATGSFDGIISFLNRDTLKIERQVDLGVPIFGLLLHEGHVYSTGYPAFRVDVDTLVRQELGPYSCLIQSEGRLFGCSHAAGITCIDDNTTLQIACSFMMPVGKAIFFASECSIGILAYDAETSTGRWQIVGANELRPGCVLLSGVHDGGFVYAVGESGQLFKWAISPQIISGF